MKKLIYIIPAFALFATVGCNKNMEEGPLENLDSSFIFDPVDKNGSYAEQFLNDIYGNMPNGWNRIGNSMLDAATDDAVPSMRGSSIEDLRFGRIDAFGNPDDVWSSRYTVIRKVNVFLANVDRVPVENEVKGYWKAEARFLRAFAYFELMKRYGGVPLMGERIGTLAEDLQVPRSSFEACVNYVSGELDAIKPLLRTGPASGGDFGRITNTAALALQARMHLYAASPLFNAGNLGTQNKELTGYTDVSAGAVKARWQKAADVARELIDLNSHIIEPNNRYINIFITRDSKEIILSYLRANSSDVEQNNGPVGFTKFSNRGYTSPTQELAEAFLMTNGKPITDPTSGYDPDQPNVNRDTRFNLVFFFNGSKWLKRTVETFDGGLDRPGGNITQTQTGYYLRKFMYNAENASSLGSQPHNFPLFRFAEVYLNYAEALTEASDATQADAVAALNKIRSRGGMKTAVPNSVSKDELLKLIRNERRVELCFEEHRFWDIRRWMIAKQLFTGDLHGQQIVRADDGTVTYTKVAVGKVAFNDRMHLYPIPQSELYRNRNLVQNPLW
ncbi:RagB/SusD family nutrient uptake outer membrane protein [Chitinophaga rhizosphaerae]|uniref:RagB/SusD family nutrient uptake outer membrane protein n=1 Tax=Chitinophaga rhizosphaerae TaxID=1864947 RepID=UPI0013E03D11|nr:RagB/SusD family nutrient uptake outer membrane protein [Chitinophaga rhizosphaerae]